MEIDAVVMIMEYSQWQLTLYFIASYFVTCCMHSTQQYSCYDHLNHPLIINWRSTWFIISLCGVVFSWRLLLLFQRYQIHFIDIVFVMKEVLLDGANTAEGRVRDDLSDGCQDGVERHHVAAPHVRGQVRGCGQHTRVTLRARNKGPQLYEEGPY